MGSNLLANYGEAVAMVLFGIGFANLLFQKNLIKKIIGFNIMDTAIYLFLAEKGYISGRMPPIVVDGITMIPVSKVSYGFASGGSDFASAKNTHAGLFAGGGGGGMTVTPVAFITVNGKGEVNVLNIGSTAEVAMGVAERALVMAPELIEQIKKLFKKDKKEEEVTEE